ncbi:hypothetical protein SDC9_131703 [bioreactor metagenome]|uniref:Uncharacterized protein n=1 Tax=bioreactor metagenome TaxID=1076179 RepID=A0A645D557_9ZZZZ
MVVKSTDVNPVTQTALVEINSESTHDMPLMVQRGSISSPVPTRMIIKKLTAKIREGLVRLPNKRTNPLDNCNKDKTDNTTT